ncbi:MAG: COQ9 family protein [Alphaproteobacteria bacterium]|nr:MAG: COQ9 family protein [Alphaproteobacteria bacterium]
MAESPQETPQVTYETRRRVLLLAALPIVAFEGWTDATLSEAAKVCVIPQGEIQLLFPKGRIGLLEAFSDWADEEMLTRMAGADLAAMKIRERITFAVRTRLEVLIPHKEAAQQATSLLAVPVFGPLAAKMLYRTVDQIWRGIGDTSTDFNFYTKRATLAAVYSSTVLAFFSDETEDHGETWAFLDRRIANVMEFEKVKAKVRGAAQKVPSPLGVLSALRYPNPTAKGR